MQLWRLMNHATRYNLPRKFFLNLQPAQIKPMNMKPLLSLLLLLSITPSYLSAANHAYVFCGKRDGNDWIWLMKPDNPEVFVKIEGDWEVGSKWIDGAEYKYPAFNINQWVYEKVAARCPKDYAPQPADSYAISWALFHIVKPDGSIKIAKGVFETLVEPGEDSYLFYW